MKNRTKPKTGNKISWFLRSRKRGEGKRSQVRRSLRKSDLYPNSSKIGAGEVIARRRNTASIWRKSSHRRSNTGKKLFKLIRTYVKDTA